MLQQNFQSKPIQSISCRIWLIQNVRAKAFRYRCSPNNLKWLQWKRCCLHSIVKLLKIIAISNAKWLEIHISTIRPIHLRFFKFNCKMKLTDDEERVLSFELRLRAKNRRGQRLMLYTMRWNQQLTNLERENKKPKSPDKNECRRMEIKLTEW